MRARVGREPVWGWAPRPFRRAQRGGSRRQLHGFGPSALERLRSWTRRRRFNRQLTIDSAQVIRQELKILAECSSRYAPVVEVGIDQYRWNLVGFEHQCVINDGWRNVPRRRNLLQASRKNSVRRQPLDHRPSLSALCGERRRRRRVKPGSTQTEQIDHHHCFRQRLALLPQTFYKRILFGSPQNFSKHKRIFPVL